MPPSGSWNAFTRGTLVAVDAEMPTAPIAPTPLGTTVTDSAELAHWIGVLRDAYQRGAHVDVIVFGEADQSTTTCWSSCPASAQKREFLQWLADTVADADTFFVPDGQ